MFYWIVLLFTRHFRLCTLLTDKLVGCITCSLPISIHLYTSRVVNCTSVVNAVCSSSELDLNWSLVLCPPSFPNVPLFQLFLIHFLSSQVEGTTERPRLCVFRSNKHIYVQVIDDSKMHTLASASTMQKPISEEFDCSAGPTIVS